MNEYNLYRYSRYESRSCAFVFQCAACTCTKLKKKTLTNELETSLGGSWPPFLPPTFWPSNVAEDWDTLIEQSSFLVNKSVSS